MCPMHPLCVRLCTVWHVPIHVFTTCMSQLCVCAHTRVLYDHVSDQVCAYPHVCASHMILCTCHAVPSALCSELMQGTFMGRTHMCKLHDWIVKMATHVCAHMCAVFMYAHVSGVSHVCLCVFWAPQPPEASLPPALQTPLPIRVVSPPGEPLVRGSPTKMPSDPHTPLLPSLTFLLSLQLPPNKQGSHQQEEQQHSRDDGDKQVFGEAPGNKSKPHDWETAHQTVDTHQLQAGHTPIITDKRLYFSLEPPVLSAPQVGVNKAGKEEWIKRGEKRKEGKERRGGEKRGEIERK